MGDGDYGEFILRIRDPSYEMPREDQDLTHQSTYIVSGSYFFYAPNKGAAGFFTIAFAATTIFHLWQCQ